LEECDKKEMGKLEHGGSIKELKDYIGGYLEGSCLDVLVKRKES